VPLDKSETTAASAPPLTDEAARRNARRDFEKGARAWREKKLGEARTWEKPLLSIRAAREHWRRSRKSTSPSTSRITLKRYKQAMHCDGTYPDAYYKLAKLDVSENKLADGEAVLLEGVRRSPSDWFFRYQLGTVHFAMGQHGEAPRDFVAAQSFHPDMPAEFHAKLANTYLKTAEYAKALAEIEAYLSLSPEGPYAASARQISATLRGGTVAEAESQASARRTDRP
jgi:tetratricopeptide (TPR) repeat protein